jgi:hypothetical protein
MPSRPGGLPAGRGGSQRRLRRSRRTAAPTPTGHSRPDALGQAPGGIHIRASSVAAHTSMYAPPVRRCAAPTGNVAQGSLFSPAVLPPRWGFDSAAEVVRISFQAGADKSRLPNVWSRRRGTAGKAAELALSPPKGPNRGPCATFAQPPLIPAGPATAKAGSGNPRQGVTNRRVRTNQCARHARNPPRSSAFWRTKRGMWRGLMQGTPSGSLPLASPSDLIK